MSDPLNCSIVIHNEGGEEMDSGMLFAVMGKLAHHIPQAHAIDVFPSKRKPDDARSDPGWLEWGIRINYRSGGSLYIGAIQRTVTAGYEFHS